MQLNTLKLKNKINYPMIDTKISFKSDIQDNKDFLKSQIFDKVVLIIGGAGTIGSSYIKQILKYKPSKITVVDINENGLTELTRDLEVLIYWIIILNILPIL